MSPRRSRKKPLTWQGLHHGRSTFDSDVNKLMGQLLEDGEKVSTKRICEKIGLDYDSVTERGKISGAIVAERKKLQEAWKIFELGPTYEERYRQFNGDLISYDLWKKKNEGIYLQLVNIGLVNEQIHDVWVSERMFDAFVENGKQNNFYFFVTEYDPSIKTWTYNTPDYWKYTVYNLKIAAKHTKAIKTLLIRHQTMHMMLTSGERVDTAYQLQDDVEKMLTDGRPNRFRCETCMQMGILKEFASQQFLVDHYNRYHSDVPDNSAGNGEGNDDPYSWAKHVSDQDDMPKQNFT